ncbi:MAG: hypothetical protein FWG14_11585 [Peptococcaceae bacterium]|nr:hypothetical protein [Peptococcaceae bacterium]
MITIIRADIYRILRGRAIYITFALAESILIIYLFGIISGGSTTPAEIYADALGYPLESVGYNGMHIVSSVLSFLTRDTSFYLLALILLVAAPLFSHNTIRNDLSRGISKTTLYVSKLILSSLLCCAMMLFFIVTGILSATALRGFGGTPPDGYWLTLLKICSSQLFMLLALTCVGVFLVFTIKHTGGVIGIFLAFCLIPSIFIGTLSSAYPDLIKLLEYDIISNITKLAFIEALDKPDLLKIFGSGAFYMAASTGAGIALFKKAEVK